MKILTGDELASYIQEQQAHQVRSLRQGRRLSPELVVSTDILKRYPEIMQYGEDVQVEVNPAPSNQEAILDQAIANALDWLLASYNINLAGKNILLVGQESSFMFVADLWQKQGLTADIVSMTDPKLSEADIIICSCPSTEIVKGHNFKQDTVIVSLVESASLIICALFDTAIQLSQT